MVWIPKPVLELKMEGNADDSSGYDNHGTVIDAVLADDRWGHPNNAYSFNGTSAYIVTTSNPLNVDANTISFWYYANEYESSNGFIDCDRIGDRGFGIKMGSSNQYRVQCAGYIDASCGVVKISQWTQITVVIDGSNVNVYENGINIKTVSAIQSTLPLNSQLLYIGRGYYDDSAIRFLNGKMDDVQIYDVVLTPTQVKYLYDKTKRNYGGLP